MTGILKKAMLAGLGLVTLTTEKVEDIVDDLVKRGEIAENDKGKAVREILDKAEESARDLKDKIETQIRDVIAKMPLSTKKETDELRQRIQQLETELNRLKSEQNQ
ncbi:MAG: hypothetical protein KBA26_12085 [Candidatus Delongbacteria bacterium]|nr:hypothetical protein [Candidatus Delongbacteria bacterium]